MQKFNCSKLFRVVNGMTVSSAQWLKWFCEAGGSPDEAMQVGAPYPFQPH